MLKETALPKDIYGNNTPQRHPDDPNLIAMKYRRRMPVIASCPPGSDPDRRTYQFTVHADICLAWVEERDVPCVLQKRGGCCGAKKLGIMVYALEHDVPRWQGLKTV